MNTKKITSPNDSNVSSARGDAELANARILKSCKSTFGKGVHVTDEGALSTMSSNKAALGEPEHLYHIGKGLKPSAGVTITLQNGTKVKGASRPASMNSDGDGSHRTHPSQVSPRSGAG